MAQKKENKRHFDIFKTAYKLHLSQILNKLKETRTETMYNPVVPVAVHETASESKDQETHSKIKVFFLFH